MARVVREDWPHLDMDMGKRQVGEGKWAGEEGPRAHTLQGLIRRASRLSPVSAVSAVYYNVVLLFRVLVSCGSSRRPCEVTSVLGLPGARDTVTDARQRHAWNAWSAGPMTASSSLILMTAESRQLLQFRTPAHDRHIDRHVGALSRTFPRPKPRMPSTRCRRRRSPHQMKQGPVGAPWTCVQACGSAVRS